MTVFAEVLITAFVLAFILYPLFRRATAGDVGGEERLGELRLKRDNANAMLGEIESDREAGVLSEKDYRELEARYRQQASGTAREIGKFTGTGTGDVNEEIERSIKQLRQGKKARFCAQCGARVLPGDRFCPRCGKSLAR